MVCPSGIVPTSNLCQLYSGYDANYIMKCDQTSSSYDHCAENWKDCLAEPYWDFCRTFPELCLNSTHLRNDTHHDNHTTPEGVKDKYGMFERICSANLPRYCPFGEQSTPAMRDVCQDWGAPLFHTDYHKELLFTSLWTMCRADLTRICETDPNLKDRICPDGKTITANICSVLPEGACIMESSDFKPCASDIYNCMATVPRYDFCHDFPQLCTMHPPAFDSFADLTSAICNQSMTNMQLCTDNNIWDHLDTICDNFHLLSDDVRWKSSFGTLCLRDKRLCEKYPTDVLCQGSDGPPTDFCALYNGSFDGIPNKCDPNGPEYDGCALNWMECLARPDWNMCNSFPELCMNITDLYYNDSHGNHTNNDTFGIRDQYDMYRRICEIDHNKYCPEGDHSPPAIWDVCANWGAPMFQGPNSTAIAFTSLWTLCRADLTRICETDDNLRNSICHNGRTITPNICAALPEGSCIEGRENFKPCAMDIYSCMAKDKNYDFCLDFPSLCPATPSFQSFDHLESVICNESTAATPFCTQTTPAELDWKNICEFYHVLSFDVKWRSSIGTQCWLNRDFVCEQEPLKSMVCPSGIVPTRNMCQLYSGYDANYIMKCDQTASSYDHCAEDWKNCLAEPYWDFCRTFPELCLNSTHLRDETHSHVEVIHSAEDMIQRICNADHQKYCPDGYPTIREVCRDWGAPLLNSEARGVVLLTSLSTLCRADIERICEQDQGLRNSICPSGNSITASICDAHSTPEGTCQPGHNNYRPCASDIYSCMATDRFFDFCGEFPYLCTSPQVFNSYADLEGAICGQSDGSYNEMCHDVGTNNMLNVDKVCQNFQYLSDEVKWSTSLSTFCPVSRHLCETEPQKVICEVSAEGPPDDFCSLYNGSFAGMPDKCNTASPDFDDCALHWKDCLARPNWNFCKSFPELCFTTEGQLWLPEGGDDHHQSPGVHSAQDMFERVCSVDPAKYCPDGVHSPPAIWDVCENWGTPLFPSQHQLEVAFTSLWTLCRANIGSMCTAAGTGTANDICPNGRTINANICSALPEGSCIEGRENFKPCASDIYSCLATQGYDFCHDFPSLCQPDPEFRDIDVLFGAVCNQSTAAMPFCRNNYPDFGFICDGNYHMLSQDVRWKSSLLTVCYLNEDKVCHNEPYKSKICQGGLQDSLCPLYDGSDPAYHFPQKCDPNMPATYDPCASNWKACLAEPYWNFCGSFPELCYTVEDIYTQGSHNNTQPDPYVDDITPEFKQYASFEELEADFCNMKSERFCMGGNSLNLLFTCESLYEIPYEYYADTALESLCHEADFEAMCAPTSMEGLGMCESGDLKNDVCDVYPDQCDANSAVYNACAPAFRSCLHKRRAEFDFCASYPDLCFPPPPTYTEDMIPPLPDAMRIDYGDPFFTAPSPKFNPSQNYPLGADKLVSCTFELVEPLFVASKILATQAYERKLFLWEGQEFKPTIEHGARLFAPANVAGTQTTSSSELIPPKVSVAQLRFPELSFGGGMESTTEQQESQEFEQQLTGDQTEVGEIIHVGENTDFNLVYLDGTTLPPSEIVYTSRVSTAVLKENDVQSVHIGFEFVTEMPKAAFDESKPNKPSSIDNWMRYAKINADGTIDFDKTAGTVVCSQGENIAGSITTYTFNSFDNGFAEVAVWQTDENQIFRDRMNDFPDMYGLHEMGTDQLAIKCLATLQVNPDDPNLYGSYFIQSGTQFSMQDGTKYVMSTTDWYIELAKDKTEPPKKEFQVQGSLRYKKDSDPIEYGVTLGYEVVQNLDSHNKLVMVFDFKSTEVSKVANEEYVGVFLRYRKTKDYGRTRYVSCGAKQDPNNQGDYQPDVNNFFLHMNNLNNVEDIVYLPYDGVTGLSEKSQKLASGRIWDESMTTDGHFFRASEDKGAHYLRVSDDGSSVSARCIAVLDLPKFSDGSEDFIGESILGEYDVQIGLVIKAEGANPSTNLRFSNKSTITLKAPKYADEIASEVSQHANVHFDLFMESGVMGFDAYTPLGKASQNVGAELEMIGQSVVNSDPNADPVLRLIIRSKIPFDALPDENNFVYRHTLRLKNEEEWDQDDLVIGCEVDSKDASRHNVQQFRQDYSLHNPDKKLLPELSDLVAKEDKIVQTDSDKKLYQAQKRTEDGQDYVFTQCAISITFDERVSKFADKIFDKYYSAQVGLHFFDKKAVAAPYSVHVTTQDTYAYLPVPAYDTDAEEEPSVAFFEQGYQLQADQADAVAFGDITWEWRTEKDISLPDQLRVSFFATFNPSMFAEQGVTNVALYTEFWPAYDRSTSPSRQTVGCLASFDFSSGAYSPPQPLYSSAGTTNLRDGSPADVSGKVGSATAAGWSVDEMFSWAAVGDIAIANEQIAANCTVTIDYPKIDRDYSSFMDYKGYVGALAVGQSLQDLGQSNIEFKLSEPVYDYGEVSDADFIRYPLDGNFKDIFANDFDQALDGFGFVETGTEYLLSPYFFADDRLAANFAIDLPAPLLADGTWVFQYVQLTPDNDPGAYYVTIACASQVNQPNSQVVMEYKGSKRMDTFSMSGKTIFEQNIEELNDDTPWQQNKDNTLYNTQESTIVGNRYQPCIAEMPIYKKNPDESIYTTWRGVGGVRIYSSETDTNPMSTNEERLTFEVKKPDYTEKIPDPKEFAAFDAIELEEEDADEEVEAQPLDAIAAEITLDPSLGFTGKAKQSVIAQFKVINEVDDPDKIDFLFQADIPRDALAEASVVYQWAQLTPKDDASSGLISVDCIVMVGNPDGVITTVYNTAIDDSAASGKDIFSISTAYHPQFWVEFIKDDIAFYELKNSDTDFKNQIQNCLAKVAIPKANRDDKIFQNYDVKYGIRIYADFEDTAPKNLGTSETSLKIKAPKYKTARIDETEGLPADTELLSTAMKTASCAADPAQLTDFSGATQPASVDVTINYIAIKSAALPDIIEFNFKTNIESSLVADNDYVVMFLQYRQGNSGDYNDIYCATKKNDPANSEVLSFTGAGMLSNTDAAGTFRQPTDHSADSKHRKNFGTEPFRTVTTGAIDEIHCSAQLDIGDKLSAATFDALFSTQYELNYGARVYTSDADTAPKKIKDQSSTFTLVKPDYKFGDEYEFKEEPRPVDGFKKSYPFQMSGFDANLSGKGFVKLVGDYKMVPNFETLMWQFTFSLAMPKQYFDNTKYVVFFGTYAPESDPNAKTTITCEVKIGDSSSAVVREYDGNFAFDKQSATSRLTAMNAASLTDANGYTRNYNPKLYNLADSIGGKSRQNCAAVAKIMPWDADELVGDKFIVSKFGAYIYDDDQESTVSTVGVETTKTYDYTMPSPGGNFADLMKPLEDTIMERQLLNFQENAMPAQDINADVTGGILQTVTTGFEFNPTLDDATDKLVFDFMLETPQALIKKGNRVVQYVTFSNPAEKKEKPITIGCTTQVGDPYVSEILTWKGFKSMDQDSKVVKNKKYNKQNKKELAKKKESFKLVQQPEWYRTEEFIASDGTTPMYLQPCIATLDMGKKMTAEDPFFATYDVNMGVRVYEDDLAKTFVQIPQKKAQVEIKMPNTDLASLYEEQQPESSAETVEYFDQSFKFKLKTFLDDPNMSGRGFQRARGGYKLYGDANAQDRWYFNLALELPTELFTDKSILYQWISYEFDEANAHLNGAASCKIEVGDYSKTSSDQWVGLIDLSSNNKQVQGQKWYKQQPDGKLKKSEFNAMWWNEELFSLKESSRSKGGYSIQECEIETVLDKSAIPDDTYVTLQVGARVYANNDAIEFKTTKEASFEWYRSQMTYTPELEIPAAYEVASAQGFEGEEKAAELDVSSALKTRIDAAAAAQAAAEAAAQAAANGDNTDPNAANDPNAASSDPNAPDDSQVDSNAAANGNLEVFARNRNAVVSQSVKSLATAKQTIKNGYQLFEKINESDWWWWWIALEISDSLLSTDEILYQFVTITDPSSSSSFTVGCAIKIGTEGESIQYFTHDANERDQLTSASSLVTGQTWAAQAADLQEEPDDIKWKAGTAHTPEASKAPASSQAGFTNHACYFYEELKKIGRNPKDFDKDLDIKFGARIYIFDAATSFDAIPETSETIKKEALPQYVSAATTTVHPTVITSTTPAGASSFTLALASFFMLFAIFY